MSAATSAPSAIVSRITAIDEIVGIIQRHHPQVVGATLLGRFLERQRIAQAIRAEAHRLDFCLVQLDDGPAATCGVLVASPKPDAEQTFAAYGSAPILFGFLFGFTTYAQFEAVMAEVCRIGWERRRHRLVGPFEATINYACGLLEAAPPFPLGVLMPDNPLSWNGYAERFGFAIAERLFTFEIELARANFRRLGRTTAKDLQLRVEPLKPPFSPAQRQAIADVFNAGWRNNWGFVPIDVDFITALEKEFAPVLWPGLSFITYQRDRPIGVLVATPDVNELTRREPGRGALALLATLWRFFWSRRARAVRIFILGLTPEFHGTREGAAVIELMLDTGKDAASGYGATHIQMGWTLSSNDRVNRLVEVWAPGAKRVVHRMLSLELSSTPIASATVSDRSESPA